jgi:small subunit ribosomal protein S20
LAQHKSAKKRIKTSRRAATRNRAAATTARKAVKDFKASKEKTADKLKSVYKTLDKTAAKKVFHKNKAARLKSRLAKMANKAAAKK